MKRLLILLLLFPGILLAQKQGQGAIDSMLKKLPAAKEDTNKVKLLNALSFSYNYIDPDEGLNYGQQALALATKLDWKPGIGRANNCIGVNYSHRSDHARALDYYSKAISVYEAIDDQALIARVLDNMAVVYSEQSDYANALDCLHKALKISEETGDKISKKNNLNILGNIYFDQSDYPQALEYYFKALKISEEIGDKDGIFSNQEGIASVYTVQKDYAKALEYHNKDLKIAEETGNKQAIAAVNANIGSVYGAQSDHIKALSYFFTSLKIEKELGQKKNVAVVSVNIGSTYTSLKNYSLAIAYEQNALKIAEEIGDKNIAAQCLLSVSEAYLGIVKKPEALQKEKIPDTGEPDGIRVLATAMPGGKPTLLQTATVQLQRGLAIAKEIHALDIMQSCYEQLTEAGKLSGNYEQALEYADSGRAVKDSIFSTGNKLKITNLETKRALDLKEKQIELDKLDLATKRHERFFYITAIILLITIGLLFINRQYLKNRKVEAEKKNAELLRNVAEKDKGHAVHLLNERIKELATIYKAQNIILDESKSIAGVFNEIVNLLPPGWQYPDVCAGRIVFDGNEYTTPNYAPSSFKQDAPIKTQDGRTGLIEVVYTKEMPHEAEGPFLKEERDLINALAGIIEVYFNKKAHQDALAKSEANFRSSFEHAAIGMALVVPNGVFMKVNKALCNMLGYSEKELLSLSFREVTHPEHLDADVENVRQILEGAKDYFTTEKRYIHKNGSVIWANLNSSIIRDSKSVPLYFVSQIEDITAKRESEQKFKGLVEKSVVGVYILQNDKFIYVNPRMCEESGYTEEELTSLQLEKFVYRDNMMTVYRNIKARMKGEVDEVRYDVRAVKKDGGTIWLEMFGTVMEYQGAPAIIGTMVNITEKKESQEMIRKSQAELSAFFDNVEGSASLVDANKRYLIFNRAFIEEHKRLTGTDPKPGMEIYEFFPPDIKASRHALLDEVLKGNKQTVEVDHIRDGRHIFYRTTFNPVVSDGKVIGISTYSIDLSEIKNAEREILRLNRLYQFISEINESMLKLENKEQIYAEACRIAVQVGKFQMAYIGTYNKKEDKITPIAWAGVEEDYFDAIDIAGMKVSQSAMLSARGIRSKTHFYCNDIATDPEIPPHVKAEMLRRNYLSGLSLPLFVNSEIVAALVLVTSEAFFFNDEEVHLLREVTDNITYALDKIRIRELHDKSEANLTSIFNNTQASFLLLDEHINILAYNEYFRIDYADQTGFELSPGVNYLDLRLPDKRELLKKIIETVKETREPVEYETSYANAKTVKYFSVTVSPVLNNDSVIGFCLVGFDITNRKNLEIENKIIVADLFSRNKDLQEFAQIVSHNLRGPLATLLGLNNMLKDAATEEDKGFVLEGIALSSEKLDAVVIELNNILNVKQKSSESMETVNLYGLWEEIRQKFTELITKSNADIHVDFSAIGELTTRRPYIYNILYNLVSNSLKYRDEKRIPQIRVWTEHRPGVMLLGVEDNGIGIDMNKHQDKIFLLNRRFNNSSDGKGLGLYLVKAQVDILQGTIEIDSEPGVGTTVKVMLPV